MKHSPAAQVAGASLVAQQMTEILKKEAGEDALPEHQRNVDELLLNAQVYRAKAGSKEPLPMDQQHSGAVQILTEFMEQNKPKDEEPEGTGQIFSFPVKGPKEPA
jgi:hypothetical protein